MSSLKDMLSLFIFYLALTSVSGQTAQTGPKGDPGDRGFAGLPGRPGHKGDQGLPGEIGPFGDDGLPGLRGPKGYPGIQGHSGPKGDDARPPTVGPPSMPSPPGPKGDPGLPGIPGDYGEKGIRGNQGASGSPGESGYPGTPGVPCRSCDHVQTGQDLEAFSGQVDSAGDPSTEYRNISLTTMFTKVGVGFDEDPAMFTAPGSGLYFFSVIAIAEGSGAVPIGLLHNGNQVMSTSRSAQSALGVYPVGTNRIVLSLSRGDTVEIKVEPRPDNLFHSLVSEFYSTTRVVFNGHAIM